MSDVRCPTPRVSCSTLCHVLILKEIQNASDKFNPRQQRGDVNSSEECECCRHTEKGSLVLLFSFGSSVARFHNHNHNIKKLICQSKVRELIARMQAGRQKAASALKSSGFKAKKAKSTVLGKKITTAGSKGRVNEANEVFATNSFKFLAGGVGGLANAIVGHPLDTAKVMMQIHTQGTSAHPLTAGKKRPRPPTLVSVVHDTVKLRGFRGLYAGFTPPATAGTLLGSGFFIITGAMRQLVADEGQSPEDLRTDQLILSSELAAPIYSAFNNPIEVVKCRMQADAKLPAGKSLYSGTWDCIMKTYQQEGIAAFMKGYTFTCEFDKTLFLRLEQQKTKALCIFDVRLSQRIIVCWPHFRCKEDNRHSCLLHDL